MENALAAGTIEEDSYRRNAECQNIVIQVFFFFILKCGHFLNLLYAFHSKIFIATIF